MEAVQTFRSSAPAPRLSSSVAAEFPLEWLAILPVAALDVVWASRIGFHLSVGALDVLALGGIFAAGFVFRAVWQSQRASLMAEYIALTVVSAAAFAVLSYLGWTLRMPLTDALLLSFERSLGFDWLRWFYAVRQQPFLVSGLHLLYASIYYQAIYFVALFGVLRDRARLREVYWIVFVTSAVTSALSALFPALGTFEVFHLGDLGGYLADMKRLRSGHDLQFTFAQLTGVISFPSFHTSMAVIYAYAFRKMGAISVVMAALNLLMLPSIPFIGGHYLADMLAGAGVALLSILVVRRFCNTSVFTYS